MYFILFFLWIINCFSFFVIFLLHNFCCWSIWKPIDFIKLSQFILRDSTFFIFMFLYIKCLFSESILYSSVPFLYITGLGSIILRFGCFRSRINRYCIFLRRIYVFIEPLVWWDEFSLSYLALRIWNRVPNVFIIVHWVINFQSTRSINSVARWNWLDAAFLKFASCYISTFLRKSIFFEVSLDKLLILRRRIYKRSSSEALTICCSDVSFATYRNSILYKCEWTIPKA